MKKKLITLSAILAVFSFLVAGCTFGREEEDNYLDAPVVQVKDQLFPQVYFRKYEDVKYLSVYRWVYDSSKKKVGVAENVGIIYPSSHAGEECRFQDRFFVEDVNYTYFGRYVMNNGEEYVTSESEIVTLTNRATGPGYESHNSANVEYQKTPATDVYFLYDPAQKTLTVTDGNITRPVVSQEADASKITNRMILSHDNKRLAYEIGGLDAGDTVHLISLVISDFPYGGKFTYKGLVCEYREKNSDGKTLFVSWSDMFEKVQLKEASGRSYNEFNIDPLNVQNGLDYNPAP
ncbi:MAG: hypothetical protein MJ176_08095 [Treponema sp.]|nr:hypothetical protein [Treponema sp.]